MIILDYPCTIRFTTSVEASKMILAEGGSKSCCMGVQPYRSRKHESTKTRRSQKTGNHMPRFVWHLSGPTCHRQRVPRIWGKAPGGVGTRSQPGPGRGSAV